uniref:CBF domain-containing protein n=1 Tax=Caenorhabditis tropicalis TaxID=1561998 RepID=A0A1I7UVR9_9PELO
MELISLLDYLLVSTLTIKHVLSVMKLKKRPMKLVAKKPSEKLGKAQKIKQKAANLASAEKVMAQFESGEVDTKKKKQNGVAKTNGHTAPVVQKPENSNQKRQLKKILGQDGLLVKHPEGSKWYSYQIDHIHDEKTEKLSSSEIQKLLEEGKDILAQDAALLQTKDKQENGSEASWLYSVISKGTAADKRTAMQLQMHKSPVHSLEYVEKLIASCKKQGTRDVVDIIPILEDVFINHCLPENRKLISFNKRALKELTELSSGNQRSRRKILMMWAFEHELKILYQQFIESLVEIIKRPLEEVIKRSLKTLANCLMGKPESENLILSALVNAFGHPNYKIGAFVVNLLEGIARKHPAMRLVMVEEIERLVFRKNVNERAHLYSITFLSQMKFTKKDSDLCCRLMQIYLALFKTIVGKKITDNRLLPIILAGANRAFPFAKEADKLLEDVKDVYYLAHNSNYRTAIPALKLLFQFNKMNDYVSDRFYNALYRKLLDNCPAGAYAQLLKLMFDTMKEDSSAQRIRSFVKRLLQVAVNSQPDFAASILILISRVQKLRGPTEKLIILTKDIDPSARVVDKMENDDDEEERYVDLDVEGNEIVRNGVKKEEEEDIVIEEEEKDDKKKVQPGQLGASSTGGWVHRNMSTRGAKSPYDTVARNPLFVDASHVADSELLLLSNHYHPSVGVFAKALMEGREINYGGEALSDFTLMAFLDRFAFRNPKDVTKTTGSRIVRKKAHDPWGVRKLAVSSNEYTRKRREEIPADERFLHRYTSSLQKEKQVKKESGEDDWEYAESVNSEEFDQLLERFEPGELNEEFDIDYSKEFGAEKSKRNKKKAGEEEDVDMDEDDDIDLNDLNEEEDGGMDDDDDEGDVEDDDDEDNEGVEEDDEDDEGDEDDDDDEEGGFGGKSSANIFGEDDGSSDEEIGENDFEMAGDKFAEMLEDLEEDEDRKGKKKGGKKRGIKRGGGGGYKRGGAKKFRKH